MQTTDGNGYQYDLCLRCKKDDDCKHTDDDSILNGVGFSYCKNSWFWNKTNDIDQGVAFVNVQTGPSIKYKCLVFAFYKSNSVTLFEKSNIKSI